MFGLKKFIRELLDKTLDSSAAIDLKNEIRAYLDGKELIWKRLRKYILGVIASLILNLVQMLFALLG